ncbi:triglyceride lipase-cholesterol [Niveomyces insectorum RCEF 264]|uniref:Triglyceride lipase-cholesterol n=1 Tax=Niveomyces insectorum RCEF 264 TaxID=1081102 RepID=A0A167VBY9_9HYPO|nr:triglyceride lipase-cholesterol [Niveomyces insectorum RCEF 264]
MPVPFIGRLNVTEYTALVSSFFLVALEAVIRILTLALPSSLLDVFYQASRRLVNRFRSPAQKRAEERMESISSSIRDASDFVDLCRVFGYTAEEHVFQTKDGYLLGLHRLAWRPGEEDQKVNAAGPHGVPKRVVYLHHGLLMNSEVWVCATDPRRCLPFVLVERGFDVWFGNNRGNKYSKKSIHHASKSTAFWNFSVDEFAFHDIPDSIAYILEATGQPSLSYVGFSQGTAQAFAALAIHPRLNDQVNVFIALAPAMSPAGLSNGVVDALVKASPQVLYLLFGRRSILSSATLWQSILYPPLFVRVIDLGLSFLFGWRTANIAASQKLAAYPHLYSYTSTKSVVHWFQIIRTKSFQMYDDDVQPPLALLRSAAKHTKVAKYPTRNIKTPVVLLYGGSDSLVDIAAMLRELPPRTAAIEVPHYEHLDFLWARDVDTQVFRHVFDALDSFPGAEHTKEQYARYRHARRRSSLSVAHPPYPHSVRIGGRSDDGDTTTISDESQQQHHQQHHQSNGDGGGAGEVDVDTAAGTTPTPRVPVPPVAISSVALLSPSLRRDGGSEHADRNAGGSGNSAGDDIVIAHTHGVVGQEEPLEPHCRRRWQRDDDDLLLDDKIFPDDDCNNDDGRLQSPISQLPPPLESIDRNVVVACSMTSATTTGAATAGTPDAGPAHKFRNNASSSLSFDSLRGGIQLGSSKAVGGVSTDAARGNAAAGLAGADEGRRALL